VSLGVYILACILSRHCLMDASLWNNDTLVALGTFEQRYRRDSTEK